MNQNMEEIIGRLPECKNIREVRELLYGLKKVDHQFIKEKTFPSKNNSNLFHYYIFEESIKSRFAFPVPIKELVKGKRDVRRNIGYYFKQCYLYELTEHLLFQYLINTPYVGKEHLWFYR